MGILIVPRTYVYPLIIGRQYVASFYPWSLHFSDILLLWQIPQRNTKEERYILSNGFKDINPRSAGSMAFRSLARQWCKRVLGDCSPPGSQEAERGWEGLKMTRAEKVPLQVTGTQLGFTPDSCLVPMSLTVRHRMTPLPAIVTWEGIPFQGRNDAWETREKQAGASPLLAGPLPSSPQGLGQVSLKHHPTGLCITEVPT